MQACMYIMYEYRTYIFKCLNICTNAIHHVIYIYTGYTYSLFLNVINQCILK